jgi:hypothetical protein
MVQMLAQHPETGEDHDGQQRGDHQSDDSGHQVPVAAAARVDPRPPGDPRPPPDDQAQQDDVEDGGQDERGQDPITTRATVECEPGAGRARTGQLDPDDEPGRRQDDRRPAEVDGEEAVQPARAEAAAAACASRRLARRYS